MAFSFRNIIEKIKEQFTPQTFINIDTGEVIKKRQYKELSEEEKEIYISKTKLPTGRTKAEEIVSQTKTRGSIEEIHSSSPTLEQEDYSNGVRYPKNKSYQRTKSSTDKKPRKTKEKKEKQSQESTKKPKDKTKEKQPQESTKKPKDKTKQQKKDTSKKSKDYTPPKPPKNVTKELEQRMELPPPTIDTVEVLKTRLANLERKNEPMFDLSSVGANLLSIVENNEAYYEQEDGKNPYIDYLLQNMEQISDLINKIEYFGSGDNNNNWVQQEIAGYITTLANVLNNGALSLVEAEQLADSIENSWYSI